MHPFKETDKKLYQLWRNLIKAATNDSLYGKKRFYIKMEQNLQIRDQIDKTLQIGLIVYTTIS